MDFSSTFEASSTRNLSKCMPSGSIKYLILFPLTVKWSKETGSFPFIVIFTAFKWVFMDTSTPKIKVRTKKSCAQKYQNHPFMSMGQQIKEQNEKALCLKLTEDGSNNDGTILELNGDRLVNHLHQELYKLHFRTFKKLIVYFLHFLTLILFSNIENILKN